MSDTHGSTSAPSASKPAQRGMGAGMRPGMGGPRGMMKGEKPRDFKGTIRKLIDYLGRYRAAVLVVFILAIGSAAFSIFGPKILGKATTVLFEGVMGQLGGTGAGVDFGLIG
ncbi:MAG TPA: ABC transporter ATP-binding protein, partial [Spirochaetales bacterium]|nr:ABC transporter ATP-binding protein [Spirochaetales bacterium]